MRTVDPYTRGRFELAATSLCTCWRIERSDGVVIGMTDHDLDLTFLGTTYRAAEGASGSALEASADLASDNSDVFGIFSGDAIDQTELSLGLFDGASVEVWRVDWEDPAARLLLKTGTIGTVRAEAGGYTAEFRSIKDHLSTVCGRIYGRTCDAAFTDAACGLAATDFLHAGTITQSEGEALTVSLSEPVAEGLFAHGYIDVALPSGTIRRQIASHTASGALAHLRLWEALPASDVVGASCSVLQGCDKRFETCRDRFANAINFRGFPYMPGHDVLTVTPSSLA